MEEVLEAIVERIPAPQGDANAPLQALIFDSVFNPFRGIIAYFRVFNGTLRKGEHVKFFNTGSEYDADEVGVLKLKMQSRDGDPGRGRGLYLLGHQDFVGRQGGRHDHIGRKPRQRRPSPVSRT